MPSPETIKKVLAAIQKRPANYQYFFDKLNSPEWIEPLFAEGMFTQPPDVERQEDRIGFPVWPESRYLARMASEVPDVVLRVALQVPATENVRVHEDLCVAACAMPAELAARWSEKEVEWVASQPYLYFLLPDRLAELVAHLATGGEAPAALRLAEAVFAVLPGPRLETPDDDEDYRIPPEPRTRFDIWHYREVLKKHTPVLVDSGGIAALRLFCKLLESAVRHSLWPEERDTPDDYSFIWRPAIEEHEQNRAEGLKDWLVVSVRDAANSLIKSAPLEVLHTVERCPDCVFQRIGLHLRRLNPNADRAGTIQLVVDREVLDDRNLHHEYYLLLEQQFDKLPNETQQQYLNLIGEGVDIEGLRWHVQGETDISLDEDEVQTRARRRQFNRLLPIRTHLASDWRHRFVQLCQEFQASPHPEFLGYKGGFEFGPTSPKSVGELEAMSMDGLLEYLNEWRPPGGHVAPSPEGLGRQLCALVTSRPDEFASAAPQFRNLDPTYVRAVIGGLRDALKQARAFQWRPVLELCTWIVGQPREIPNRVSGYLDLDPGWGWTRKAIADLISTGTEAETGQIPLEFRDVVWKVIEPLTEDPNPTPQEEERQGGANIDPASLSINTTRGEAMHAVVKYALWIRRHNDELASSRELAARGFEEMLEVRAVLDRHLDPGTDPSLAVRAVYGQWLPWLTVLDRHWVADALPRVFPQTPESSALRDAAWETYITHCPAYDNVFDILLPEYGLAVERVSVPSRFREGLADPSEGLAEHLATLYWRGRIALDSPDGLIGRLFSGASAELRAHIFDFIGRSIRSEQQQVSEHTLNRLRTLWEVRLQANREMADRAARREIVPFGWWFAFRRFQNVWAISQLQDVLRLRGEVEPDHMVVERLAELAPEYLKECVACLRLMIEGDSEGWRPYGWREHTRTILGTAIESGDTAAKQDAEDLVHRLGALGHLEYRDLLT